MIAKLTDLHRLARRAYGTSHVVSVRLELKAEWHQQPRFKIVIRAGGGTQMASGWEEHFDDAVFACEQRFKALKAAR